MMQLNTAPKGKELLHHLIAWSGQVPTESLVAILPPSHWADLPANEHAEAMLSYCRKHDITRIKADTLLDFFRGSTMELILLLVELDQLGVSVHIGESERIAGCLLHVAQWQSAVRRIRQQSIMDREKARGTRIGRPLAAPEWTAARLRLERSRGRTYKQLAKITGLSKATICQRIADGWKTSNS